MLKQSAIKAIFAIIRSIQYQKAFGDETEVMILLDALNDINDRYQILSEDDIKTMINNPITWPKNKN